MTHPTQEVPAAMELVDVDVAYHGDIRILRGLSLKVRPGLITGVIGPNGAGKSTALRALYGLLKPVAGDVLIDGQGSPACRRGSSSTTASRWCRSTAACSTSFRSMTTFGSPAGRFAATAPGSRTRWSAPTPSFRCCATSAATWRAR